MQNNSLYNKKKSKKLDLISKLNMQYTQVKETYYEVRKPISQNQVTFKKEPINEGSKQY